MKYWQAVVLALISVLIGSVMEQISTVLPGVGLAGLLCFIIGTYAKPRKRNRDHD